MATLFIYHVQVTWIFLHLLKDILFDSLCEAFWPQLWPVIKLMNKGYRKREDLIKVEIILYIRMLAGGWTSFPDCKYVITTQWKYHFCMISVCVKLGLSYLPSNTRLPPVSNSDVDTQWAYSAAIEKTELAAWWHKHTYYVFVQSSVDLLFLWLHVVSVHRNWGWL